jgi:hypothetical protein
MSRRFYIHQFDAIWSFPESGFRALLEVGARDAGYDLDDRQFHGQRLAGRFACGRFNDTTGAKSLRVPRRFKDSYLISPLDWSAEDFREELDRFQKKEQQRQNSRRVELLPFTHQMPEGFRTRCCKAAVIVVGSNGARRNSRRIEWVRCTGCNQAGWAGDREHVPPPNIELLMPWQDDDGSAQP